MPAAFKLCRAAGQEAHSGGAGRWPKQRKTI